MTHAENAGATGERHGRWMIYGANGYTGQLVVEEAVRRGHRPVLAGRSQPKLQPLAERFGLDWVVADLRDEQALTWAVQAVDLVFHAAGPFIHTSAPMLRACLVGHTHYVDITGEIPVFEHTFTHDEQARAQGIALISGAGFDVVPTDCLARYVADKLPDALTLAIAIDAIGQASAGTTKTMLELLPEGGRVRRDGALVPWPLGTGGRVIPFADGNLRPVLPLPLADLATAYRSTGIPHITTYLATPPGRARMLRAGAPLLQRLMAVPRIRRQAQRWVERRVQGPDETRRQTDRSSIWAQVTNARGEVAEAWLETAEGYHFTALAGVRCVERLLAGGIAGALTPAQALGADFVLEVPGTRRFDRLPA